MQSGTGGYSDSEELCARFVCDAGMYPELNHNISDDLTFILHGLCVYAYFQKKKLLMFI